MKTLQKWIAAVTVGSFALVAGEASANMLAAPGFEPDEGAPDASGGDVQTTNVAPGNPWIGYNVWTGFGYYTAATAHSGDQAGKTFSTNGGLYQLFNVNPGEVYKGSAWFLNSTEVNGGADVLSGDFFVDVRLIFKDSNGTDLATIVSPTVITAASPQNTWIQLTVQGEAPAGATQLQYMLKITGTAGGGALYADDASLELIPEPASLALLGLGGLMALRRRR